MRVKWTEHHFVDYDGEHHFSFEREGEVISSTSNWFWGTTTLGVACTDGKIRTIDSDKVKIIEDGLGTKNL